MNKQKKENVWVSKTINVLMPVDGYGKYLDIFTYLAKVVDSCDPKYEYIIGLLNTCHNRGSITDKQTKMAGDIISFYRDKGYFEESIDE